jgi:hypothetical protein
MTEFTGRQIELGVATEATRNTAESTASKWVKNVTADIISQVEKIQDDNKRGRLEKHDGGRVVQKWLEGNLEGVMHIDAIGYMFHQLYGDVTTTTVSGSVKQHVFSLDQTITHPTLTFFAKDGGVNQVKLNGGVVASLELSATVDDYVRFTSTCVALKEAADTSTPTYGTEYDFIGRDVSIKVAATEAGLTSATALDAKNVTITWTVDNIRNHILGKYAPDANFNPNFDIEVSVTKDYTDNTFKDLFESDDYKYVQIHIEGEADIGAGNNPSLTLLLNKAQVTAWSRSGGADELVTEEFTLKGFYNSTDTEMSELTLINLTAEYSDES